MYEYFNTKQQPKYIYLIKMCTVRVTLRPGSTVASQQTTRHVWAAEGPCTPYDCIRELSVPTPYRKRSQIRTDPRVGEGYYSFSNDEPNLFIPVEFNIDHHCWVEIQWITEPQESVLADHWSAYRIAGEELGLDITIKEYNQYENAPDSPNSSAASFRAPLNTSTPISRAPSPATSTSSRPSMIELFPPIISPQTQELIRLAEILHIDSDPMSQTITMQAQVGTIDPNMGHMLTEDDIAVNQVIGPDRADPPSNSGSNWRSNRPYGGRL